VRKGIAGVAVLLGVLLGYLVAARGPGNHGSDRATGPATRSLPEKRAAADPALPAGPARPGSSASRDIPPPRFATKSTGRVESDPTKPGYDPVDLLTIGNNTLDVFRAEPRSDPWAGKMEKLLGTSVTVDVKHFSKRAKVIQTECRTSSCLVTVEAPDDELKRISLALQIAMRGDIMRFESAEGAPAGWHRQVLYVGFRQERREIDRYTTWQKDLRKEQLDYLRSNPEALAVWKLGHVQVPAE
jgi:hypothetical protein